MSFSNDSSNKTKPNEPMKWLMSHLDYQGSDCLLWPFCRDSIGRARVRYKNENKVASRVILSMICEGEGVVRHKCGNGHKGCVNPNHLQWGTQRDNVNDAIMHGTHIRGESVGSSILKESQVIEIKKSLKLGKTLRELSEKYGVSISCISAIRIGRTWSHLNVTN